MGRVWIKSEEQFDSVMDVFADQLEAYLDKYRDKSRQSISASPVSQSRRRVPRSRAEIMRKAAENGLSDDETIELLKSEIFASDEYAMNILKKYRQMGWAGWGNR